ncbi:class I SAM-dependent methyltransferase [Nocardioides sp.]|uniref:class I SAM-dependent methyltransferase n=1 Tax=Nocardioides sp. TaxID=35761 RepID=UPI002D809D50|nr:class I SAM-dependent methyltransferase [Nocardioides sp.]HET8959178.1 class I SAM-dependent methyltransferase [Nocardioides sp.]
MTSPDPVELWNDEAETFDDAADHGLRDPEVRAAWRDLLLSALPPAPARVADLGCGTGTLPLLLAGEGYDVTGVDFSPEMLRRAEAKAGDRARFVAGDAADPPLQRSGYDAVLCRHVLWALPDRPAVLRRWVDLLAPGGRLLLVEGSWSTGAGLTAAQTLELVEGLGRQAELRLLPDPAYWGRKIDDERYLVVSRR